VIISLKQITSSERPVQYLLQVKAQGINFDAKEAIATGTV